MINGVSDAVNNNTFKEYFSEHFDFTYAAAYYLQMVVFGMMVLVIMKWILILTVILLNLIQMII